MTRLKDLRTLATLSQLVLDQRLAGLRQAAGQLERSRAQLQAITAAAAPADLPPVAAGLVDIAYRRWADIRRTELTAAIARQTVDWMEAKAGAATAFGRLQALKGAADRLEE
ncbi:hypothetical protein [Tabrizicola sp.]|uniref:hypothetical protein n=1 Tax=Tabrizicola sp. TaxID=2005166 RepID=UPI0035B01EDD